MSRRMLLSNSPEIRALVSALGIDQPYQKLVITIENNKVPTIELTGLTRPDCDQASEFTRRFRLVAESVQHEDESGSTRERWATELCDLFGVPIGRARLLVSKAMHGFDCLGDFGVKLGHVAIATEASNLGIRTDAPLTRSEATQARISLIDKGLAIARGGEATNGPLPA